MPRYCSANITTGALLQVRRDISESNDAEGLYKLYMFPKRGRLDGWDGYQQHTNPTRRGNVDCQIHRLNHETVSATVPGSHFCGYTHAHTEFAEIVQADRIMKLKKVLYTINFAFPSPSFHLLPAAFSLHNVYSKLDYLQRTITLQYSNCQYLSCPS